MSTTVMEKGNGTGFEPAPAGAHVGVCVGVIDLGTQSWEYGGKINRHPKMLLMFELVGTEMEDGRPFTISEEFTSYFSEKANLRKFLEAWRGRPFTEEERKGFGVEKLLGAVGYVNVIHEVSKKGRTFGKIKSIMPLPKGSPKPAATNGFIHYQIEDGRPGDEIPEWIRNKILDCEEFKNAPAPPVPGGPPANDTDDLDDVPF